MIPTAVEWLYERLERMIPRTALYNIDKVAYLEQAKEIEKQQIADAMQFTYMNIEEDFIGVDYFYEIRFNDGKNICPNCKQGILRLDRPGKMGCSIC